MLKAALVVVVLIIGPAAAQSAQGGGDEFTKYIIMAASADSWNSWGGNASVHSAEVQGGRATRIVANKGANPWDAGANIVINKPLQKGDVVLAAFWARVVTPPKGRDTGVLSNASISGGSSQTIVISGNWEMYYVSTIADADYKAGKANLGLQLAADEQTVELGPVFVLDFGPNYDASKLPRNKTVTAQPVATAAPKPYAAELAQVQAKLPSKGTLLNDPGTLYSWGADQNSKQISVPEIGDGKVTRVVVGKAGTHPWDDGASAPVGGAIKKGDALFVAVYVRASDLPAGTQAGQILSLGLTSSRSPGTAIAAKPAVSLPRNSWVWVYASGIASQDYAPGETSLGMQLGAVAQTLDFGPVFVLDLGPGVDTAKLPNG